MFEYTKNNHIQYTFDNFSLTHGKAHSHRSWRDECKNAAMELYDLYGNDLVLLLSGGLDSEVVLHSFLSIGVKPKVIIFKYENNLNLHDINYAYRICAARQIVPIVKEVNVLRFFETELPSYAKVSGISSPQLNFLLYNAFHVDGIPIISAGENYLSRKIGGREVYDVEEEKLARMYDFFLAKNRESIPAFFQYTPELMVSFLQRESVYHWVETAKSRRYINIKKVKCSFITEEFDVEPRGKLTGFELLDKDDKKQRDILEQTYENREQWTEFTDYIRSFGIELLRDIKYEKNDL